MDAIVQAYDGNVQMIDSTSVRVHQHAAGAKKGDYKAMLISLDFVARPA